MGDPAGVLLYARSVSRTNVEDALNRTIVMLLAGGLLATSACADPELEARLTALESKVAAMEKAGPAGPAGAPAAPAANQEEETAAGNLLKEITEASDAGQFDVAKAKLAELKEKFGNTRAAKAAVRLESELEVIGRPEAALTVERWYQGNEADIRGGKATLYVFWEVWCPHCKREVPKLSETYTKFGSKGLKMVGLTKQTRDVTEQQVTDFIRDQKVNYPIAKEQGDALSQAYGVRGIPAAAVVKNGKVVWRGHPAKITDQMIEGWIN